ncbi:tachylectin-related carbohydrate-binding protein [Flindersiella endophytica]
MTKIPIESVEYETVTNLIDAAGPIGTGFNIIKFIYEFGKTSPVEYAIEDIRREIERIQLQLDGLEHRLDTNTQKIVKAENLARQRLLREQVVALSARAFQISNNPTDRAGAATAAFEAGQRADTFLVDEDLWLWSDVRIVTLHDENGQPLSEPHVEPVGPDFKVALALPVYSMALAVTVAGMMTDTGGDKQAVRERYGEWLDRHITAVSVRPDWRDDGREAVTVPERIRARITCMPMAQSKFAQNGVCQFTVQCNNDIDRTRLVMREFSVTMDDPGPTILCTINPEVVVQDERQVEEEYPPIMGLALWEEMLKSIAASGHLPGEQFIGVFPNWTAWMTAMYAVDRDLNLDYFRQTLPSTTGAWEGPLRVGNGWNFEAIIPGGVGAVLAKRPDGQWLWYYHRGGDLTPPNNTWIGPNSIGTWNGGDPALTKWFHFGAGYGVVYGIVLDDPTHEFTVGDLYWNHFSGYLTGQGGFTTPQRIGNGWDSLNPVFSGSEGTIYGIRPNGLLRWYNHTGWPTGANTWAEPRDLNTNVDWRPFERLVPGGEGVIYGILPNGAMRCFRHLGWRNGDDRLEGPLSVGRTWRLYRPLFAAQPGAIGGLH